MYQYDAVIVGSGPNGLAAGIKLAQSGYSVKILEAKESIGGGLRSSEIITPGFVNDICSAIHPLGIASPYFKKLPLIKFGLEWILPPISLAHPFDDGQAALLKESIFETAESLGEDENNYINRIKPLVENWDLILEDILSPVKIPSHPVALSKFGFYAVQPAEIFIKKFFSGRNAKSLFAGVAAHSILSLNKYITSAVGLVLLILGHKSGWPFPKGGSQKIADALSSYFKYLGGEIETNHPVFSLTDLPSVKAVLFDITPKQILKILDGKLPEHYKNQLKRYRYGPGVFKIDWALSSHIPFKSGDCLKASTVHIGGSYDEIIQSEYEVSIGKHPEKPFIILTQPSLFDKSRAPEGKHTAWAYCHVPNGSNVDMTERIENQLERFAPGFKDMVIGKYKTSTNGLEKYNFNYIGGDINGGMQDWRQLITRPVKKFNPYAIPIEGYFICSSSTPPGGGVHGMCGYNAALKVIKFLSNS
ncbi:MAG: NAD(P)/FAD-dependent oxidoreductase [Ignavibacteriaceae bacterium]